MLDGAVVTLELPSGLLKNLKHVATTLDFIILTTILFK